MLTLSISNKSCNIGICGSNFLTLYFDFPAYPYWEMVGLNWFETLRHHMYVHCNVKDRFDPRNKLPFRETRRKRDEHLNGLEIYQVIKNKCG